MRSKAQTSSDIQGVSAQVSNETIAAYGGIRGMFSRVGKFSGSGSHAAIEYKLPIGEYFELFVKAMINPYELKLSQGKSIYPLYFLTDQNFLSIAARIHLNEKNILQTRLVVKDPSGNSKIKDNNDRIEIQKWLEWRLVLRRIETRETSASLFLGGNINSSYEATISYDSTSYNPNKVRIGIGFCSSDASGTIFTDNVSLSGKI